MKKICLIISFIICLLCFTGCKNNDVNPNVPDNPNQEQTGTQTPEVNHPSDEDVEVSGEEEIISGENTPDEGTTDEENPDVVIPDDNTPEVVIPDTPTTDDENINDENQGEDVENPDDGNEEIPGTTTSAISNSLTNIVTKAGAEVAMPMQDAIPAESSLGFIGLSEEDFNKYVVESVVYESMISPAFQSLCIVKVNDSANIEALKKSILDNSNPRKWVCTSAEKVVVVNSGNYIMLAMSTEDLCTKLVTAFGEEFGGNLGETLTKAGEL